MIFSISTDRTQRPTEGKAGEYKASEIMNFTGGADQRLLIDNPFQHSEGLAFSPAGGSVVRAGFLTFPTPTTT